MLRFGVEWKTRRLLTERLSGAIGTIIIPGYYGRDDRGFTRVFKRGGSDRTGALVAGALGKHYYNYTDVAGVFSAPPDVPGSRPLDIMTRRELRENDNGGSGVVMGGCVIDLDGTGVVVTVKDTFHPDLPGTRIVPKLDMPRDRPIIAVTGREDVVQLRVEEVGMDEEHGYAEFILSQLRKAGLSIEHMPSVKDAFSVTVHNEQRDATADRIASAQQGIRYSRPRATVELTEKGVVYVVGEGLSDPFARQNATGRLLGIAAMHKFAALPITAENSPSIALLVQREAVRPLVSAIHEREINGEPKLV